MLVSIPDANQTFREITFEVISKRIESDVHPRVFFRTFPAGSSTRATSPTRGRRAGRTCWSPRPTRPPEPGRSTWRAAAGWSSTVPSARSTWCWRTATGTRSPRTARPIRSDFPGALVLALNPEPVFPDINIQRGLNEKTIPELRHDMADKIKNGISPHPEIITIQQKFSIPVACLVFALVGLALGMSVARDGKLAASSSGSR